MTSYLELAVKQAMRSQCRYRVGAVLTRGGRILACSCNRYRNSSVVDYRHATFHAEEVLLRLARSTYGTVIYVARVNKAGRAVMARPCTRCQKALASSGISRAHYTTMSGPAVLDLSQLHR
ncbi:hypothetical protein [Streptomyces sp. NPDC001635]|nr:hypothetical protein E4K10_46690 [Streptomyces sp. T1317-0309]